MVAKHGSKHRTSGRTAIGAKKHKNSKKTKLTNLLLVLWVSGILIGSLLSVLHILGNLQYFIMDIFRWAAHPIGYSIILFVIESALCILLLTIGFWAVSAPISCGIIIFYGISIGLTVSSAYQNKGILGFLFILIAFVLPTTISTFAIIYGVEQSFRMSLYFFAFSFEKEFHQEASSYRIVKMYFRNFITILPWLILSAVCRGCLCWIVQTFIPKLLL